MWPSELLLRQLKYQSAGKSEECQTRPWYFYATTTQKEQYVAVEAAVCKCLVLRNDCESVCGNTVERGSRFCRVHTNQQKLIKQRKDESTTIMEDTGRSATERLSAANDVIMFRNIAMSMFNDNDPGHVLAIKIIRELAAKLTKTIANNKKGRSETQKQVIKKEKQILQHLVSTALQEEKKDGPDDDEILEMYNTRVRDQVQQMEDDRKEQKRKYLSLQIEGFKDLQNIKEGELITMYFENVVMSPVDESITDENLRKVGCFVVFCAGLKGQDKLFWVSNVANFDWVNGMLDLDRAIIPSQVVRNDSAKDIDIVFSTGIVTSVIPDMSKMKFISKSTFTYEEEGPPLEKIRSTTAIRKQRLQPSLLPPSPLQPLPSPPPLLPPSSSQPPPSPVRLCVPRTENTAHISVTNTKKYGFYVDVDHVHAIQLNKLPHELMSGSFKFNYQNTVKMLDSKFFSPLQNRQGLPSLADVLIIFEKSKFIKDCIDYMENVKEHLTRTDPDVRRALLQRLHDVRSSNRRFLEDDQDGERFQEIFDEILATSKSLF